MILIGIPTRGLWSPAFGLGLAGALAHLEKGTYMTASVDGESCPQARNRLSNMAVAGVDGHQFTHLMQFDDDMIFPLDIIERLVSWDVNIIGANYPTRKGTPVPTASLNGERFWDRQSTDPNKVHDREEVDVIGGGFLCVKVDVLRAMTKPYFKYEYRPNTDNMSTEDVWFCVQARNMGYKVWCDMRLSEEVAHGTVNNTMANARLMRKIENKEIACV